MRDFSFNKKDFLLDGKPFRIFSGAIHYFRVPEDYWYDRLLKMKECGLNTLETYVCWNLHEPREGSFDFSGRLDIVRFLQTAKDLGLYVILRPGPYICAEWEFGGLPAWILTEPHMRIRCNDATFIAKVRAFYETLLPMVRPFLYKNGGNIIMMQVENEYGSYGDDKEYLRAIAKIYQDLDMDCLYFTSDGARYSMLGGGTLEEYLCVANFGSGAESKLNFLSRFRPGQPQMCGEYWCGWFDHWFEPHHVRPAKDYLSEIKTMLDMGASFNIYMFHGGTNFGFTSGANHGGKFEPTVTSYDYGAPLSEAGDRTEGYYMLRDMIRQYTAEVPELTASETPKAAYGVLHLTERADLFENLERLAKPVHNAYPLFMEDLGQNDGYILYRSTITGPREELPITLTDMHDRAQIFVDGQWRGTYERWSMPEEEQKITLAVDKGQTVTLDILVENMGRVNYGPMMMDRKGISSVNFRVNQHFGWDHYALPMNNLDALHFVPLTDRAEALTGPVFLRGSLHIEGKPCDTFARPSGFHKGFIVVNGFNLGRYFNDAGPQRTLYLPATVLHEGENEILIFESDSLASPTLIFENTPDLGEVKVEG